VNLREITPPTEEPLSVDEVRVHLRLGDIDDADSLSDDDTAWIESKIKAAREYVEDFVGFPLTDGVYGYALDAFDDILDIPAGFDSLEAITYLDEDHAVQTLDEDEYLVDDWSRVVYPAETWPTISTRADAVRLHVRGKYTADTVPESIKHAMLLLVGHWYEVREASSVGQAVTLTPLAVESLLRPYRIRLGMA
jgi:uncharacterized phiE125 gp8 family phage protein